MAFSPALPLSTTRANTSQRRKCYRFLVVGSQNSCFFLVKYAYTECSYAQDVTEGAELARCSRWAAIIEFLSETPDWSPIASGHEVDAGR